MTSALWDVQQGLYAVLAGDAALGALVQGVFDRVPEGQAYPYVEIGEATEVPFRTLGRAGSDATITLHVWSRAGGFRETKQILSRLHELLDGKQLVAGMRSTVLMLLDDTRTLRDSDGLTRHGIARYRVVTQEAM